MSETRRIPLDRRVLVVRGGRIDLRPERGAVIFPLAGLLISAALFASVVLFAGDLSATALVLILLPGLLLAPFAAMGLVYSVIGAAIVVEKEKQSVCFQQGVLGLGIGTMDLVPFWKIDHIVVEDFEQGIVAPGPHPLDFRAWDIVLVKVSGKRLPIAQVIAGASGDLIEEGWDRALDAAEAIAEMTGSRVVITAEIEAEEPVKPATESGKGRASVSAEAEILRKYHAIAVVGLSNDETRVSHSVSKYMQSAGYRIVPVSPVETEVLGEKAYPTVATIPAPVEIVNVFRRPKAVTSVVDDAIAAGAKVIWMQEGIVNEEAAAKARAAGLEVVMDRCIRSEHRRLVASD